jgi:hypothetical protein
MKILWSWAETGGHKAFLSPFDEALSIILSFYTWSKYYSNTELVTTKYGEYLFKDILKLPFDTIKPIVPDYDGTMPWNYSKFWAFKEQDSPYLHVDNDTYIFSALPTEFMLSEVMVQNYEQNNRLYTRVYDWYYESDIIIPPVFEADRRTHSSRAGYCCGIIGFNNMDLHNLYISNTFDVLYEEKNVGVFKDDFKFMILEQGVLDSLQYIYSQFDITCLIGQRRWNFIPKYVHAWSNTKREPEFSSKMYKRVKELDPSLIDIANRYSEVITNE